MVSRLRVGRVALALVALSVSAHALESGAPTLLGSATSGNRYREQKTLSSPKDDSTGVSHGHDGKCYLNAEIATVLRENPDWVTNEGRVTGIPDHAIYPGTVHTLAGWIATYFDAVEAAAPGTRARQCISLRLDVYRKQAICTGTSAPGATCTIGGAACSSGAACHGVHDENELGPFDDAWLLAVPNQWWTDYITNEWGTFTYQGIPGADSVWLDAVRASSPTTEPLPYASASYASDTLTWGGFLPVDLRISAARAWSVKNVLKWIRAAHAGCVEIGWKPGWWANTKPSYSQASNECANPLYKEPAGGMGWSGWAHNGVCTGGTNAGDHCTVSTAGAVCTGGGTCNHTCADNGAGPSPAMPSPYGPGEFESAANAVMADLFAALDTNGRCKGAAYDALIPWTACTVNGDCPGGSCELFSSVKINQQERPDSQDCRWCWITEANQSNPHMGGEYSNPSPAPGCAVDGACPDLPVASCDGRTYTP